MTDSPETVSPQTVSESIEIAVTPETAFDAISDVARMADWSPEVSGAKPKSYGSLKVGAKFGGTNKRGIRRWNTVSTVVRSHRPSHFAFDSAFAGMPIARWSYQIDPAGAGCTVTETWTDQRVGFSGAVMKGLGLIASGVLDRATHNRAGMKITLANMKKDLEAP